MLVAIIPVYNEERFIGSVVLKARKYAEVVIVVDDGSDDATVDVARAAGALVLRHTQNQGKGAALNSGFQKARELGATELVILDGDGQHRAEDIPRLVEPIRKHEADMVLGSRFKGQKNYAPFYRQIGQWFFTLLTNLSSGVTTSDTLTGYRAFSRTAMDTLDFHEAGFGVETELQFQAGEHHLRVVEVPIIVLYRDQAKRNPLTYGLRILNAILRLVGQHRPLLFFGLTGVFILLLGLACGVWVVEVYSRGQGLAIGTALISILLTIVGTITFFNGIILHSMRGLILDHRKTDGH